jgi:hypothetical protein
MASFGPEKNRAGKDPQKELGATESRGLPPNRSATAERGGETLRQILSMSRWTR